MQWYYLDSASQQQPFDDESLASLVQSGQVGPDTLIWNEEMADWTAAGTVLPDWFPAAAQAPDATAPAVAAAPVIVPKKQNVALRKAPAGSVPGSALASPGQQRAGTSATPGATGVTGGSGQVGDAAALVKRIAGVLTPAGGWMKFTSIMLYIFGGAYVILGLLLMVGIVVAGKELPGAGPKIILLLMGLLFLTMGFVAIMMGVRLWGGASRSEMAQQTGEIQFLEQSLTNVRKFFVTLGILALLYLLLMVGLFIMNIVIQKAFLDKISRPPPNFEEMSLPPGN